jgi:NADH-quinone oxidoreductase subunit N
MIDNISWLAIYPEILLLVMACVIALVDLGVKSPRRTGTYVLTLLTLGVVAVLQGMYASSGNTFYGWGNMVVSDAMGNWLKCFATVAMMVTLVYGRPYAADRDMLRGGELFTLAMLALLGMFIMISGNNFLVIYLGLELLTLSSYALVALRRDHTASVEAAMKYFVLGAMASGFLLYGMSMLYGATGSLDIGQVFKAINSGEIKHQVLVFGLVFVVSGLAFKLGVVPFHMWVPDVYQGAPTAITTMIGGAPKLAAFAIVIRLLVDGLLPLAIDWQQMLAVLAIASLLVGNLAGLQQTNLKRMLAYSTISQMGFMLLGLLSGVYAGSDATAAANAYSSAMFYSITYVLTTLGTFGVIMLLSRSGFEAENLEDFKGLNQRSPWFAAIMMVLLLSLAGVPPMMGFYAKLAVLQSVLGAGKLWLAIVAVLFSLVGAYYYLRIIKLMYFDDAIDRSRIVAYGDMRVALSLNGVAIVVLGLLPGPLMAVCSAAIVRTLAS